MLESEQSMSNVLIVYGTGQGQTAKIAQRIAEVVRSRGHRVDVIDGRDLPPRFRMKGYDAGIIGASIHMGRYQRYIHRFVKANLAELQRLPSAFFSVSMSAQGLAEGDREQAQQYVAKFLQETGWQPQVVASFAGALPFSRYGFFKRQMVKAGFQKTGLQIDPHRDYEFTDWQAVGQFAEAFLAALHPSQTALSVHLR